MRPTTSPETTLLDARHDGWVPGCASGSWVCSEAHERDPMATPARLPRRRGRLGTARGPALTDSRAQPDARMVT